jgi:hypothetical protein
MHVNKVHHVTNINRVRMYKEGPKLLKRWPSE